ncbi:MAG TPA: ABC transporter permease [Vicinamibacterales bacterium]|nr:ABC transporter permease [Vicinamibacterales bacterium]
MTALDLALRIVRVVSALVPGWRRGEWIREWEGELHAQARWSGGRSALARSSAAGVDAVFLRTNVMAWDLWWGDVRFAARTAARRPGFTALVALTLALGLGVNSAVFALVDAVLLRSLPYRDPSRLVYVWQTLTRGSSLATFAVYDIEATPFDYDAWRSARSLSEIGVIAYGSFTLTGGDVEPERLRGARVSSSMVSMLGLAPAIGRAFSPSEDFDAAPAVVILSDGIWRRRFGGDPGVVGRAVQVDGAPHVVIGVMRRGAALPGAVWSEDFVWLPIRMTAAERSNQASHNYTVIARLGDAATLSTATAELQTIAAQLEQHRRVNRGLGVRLATVAEQTTRGIKPAMIVAAASVGLLLVVATANASTLLIARTSNRRQEFALRSALGATRERLLWLSIAESLVFAAIGGLAGLVLGRWTLRAIVPLFAGSLPPSIAVAVDTRTALFTAGLAMLIGIAFGVMSAYRAPAQPIESLGSTRMISSPRAARGRQALVVAQVALAVVLLSAAGLMVNSIVKLSGVKPGFDPAHLLTFNVVLTGSRYAPPESRAGFVSQLVARANTTPGVHGTAVSSTIPFIGRRGANTIEIEGHVPAAGEMSMIVDQRYVSPDYAAVMRIPLLKGRFLDSGDDTRSEPTTVINRTMAARYFGDANPLDRRVRTNVGFDSNVWFRIVGVVDDVRHVALNSDPVPEMYRPVAQTAPPVFTVVVRTEGEPAAMTGTLRAVVQSIDSDLPIADVRTMDERIAGSFAQTRATMLLLIATAALSAGLAAIAICGSVWYSVVQRTPEIGVRVALGASRASVFRDVVGGALRLAILGAAMGIAGAIASGRLLQTMLFDTRVSDPWTHAFVAAGVLALSVAASLAPAFRAMRIDPLRALRAE